MEQENNIILNNILKYDDNFYYVIDTIKYDTQILYITINEYGQIINLETYYLYLLPKEEQFKIFEEKFSKYFEFPKHLRKI